jgi:hypothetical protein
MKDKASPREIKIDIKKEIKKINKKHQAGKCAKRIFIILSILVLFGLIAYLFF